MSIQYEDYVMSTRATDDRLRCRCVWDGRRCPNKATQEDMLCDWCGPHSVAVGGAGESHQREELPTACWLANSGAVVLDGS